MPQIAVAYEVSGDTVVYDLGESIGGGDPVAPLISEFQPNPDGQDPADVNIELSGEAGEAFDLWLVSVEDDGDNGTSWTARPTSPAPSTRTASRS